MSASSYHHDDDDEEEEDGVTDDVPLLDLFDGRGGNGGPLDDDHAVDGCAAGLDDELDEASNDDGDDDVAVTGVVLLLGLLVVSI